MTKLLLIVLILFITTDIVYSQNSCPCPAVWDPVCSTTNETHGNECSLLCANQVLACRRECPCVTVSVNATATPPFYLVDRDKLEGEDWYLKCEGQTDMMLLFTPDSSQAGGIKKHFLKDNLCI